MELKNSIKFQYMVCSKYIQNHINVMSTTQPSEQLQELFAISLYCVEQTLDKENKKDIPIHINIIFADDFNISFEDNTKNECGLFYNLIIYPLKKIENLSSEKLKLFIFTEELAHCIWNIKDEHAVKLKVIDILKFSNYNITMEDVKAWNLNLN